MQKVRKAGTTDRNGASLNTNRDAFVGMRSSLRMSLSPSARVMSRPHGPAHTGPWRFCMPAISLRSNQMVRMTATSRMTKASTTFSTTMPTSVQPMSPLSRGSRA